MDSTHDLEQGSDVEMTIVEWLRSIHLRPPLLLAISLACLICLTLAQHKSCVIATKGIPEDSLGWLGFICILAFMLFLSAVYQKIADWRKEDLPNRETLKALNSLCASELDVLKKSVSEVTRTIEHEASHLGTRSLVSKGLLEEHVYEEGGYEIDEGRTFTHLAYTVPQFVFDYLNTRKGRKLLGLETWNLWKFLKKNRRSLKG